MATILRQRRDTAANWSSANPVIPDGQLCFDTTNNTFRVGDGTTNYSSLSIQSGLPGDMSGANNLSEIVTPATARTNLGLAIGTDVQAFDSTIVVDADIGTTVQAYDATIVVDADIGTTVQAYDSTIVVDADIGTTVQGYDADTTKNDVANTFTAEQTVTEFTETVYALTGTVIDPANGGIQSITLSAATAFTAPNLDAGQTVVLMITNGLTNAITFPAITWVTSAGNVAPTLTDSSTVVIWKVGSTLYGAFTGSYV
jgi:hypothetical protein